MKWQALKVVALWAIVGFTMWFGWGMVGSPKHFMAFLFVAGTIVLAAIPAVWESLLLAMRVVDTGDTSVESQVERLVDSGAEHGTVVLDDDTVINLRWESMRESWYVELLAYECDKWFTLSWDRFYSIDDAADWMMHASQLSH